MKYKIMPLLLLIWPYLIFPVLLLIRFFPLVGDYVVWCVPVILCGILLLLPASFFFLWVCRTKFSVHKLSFWNCVLKLGHIPFYLLVFLLGIVVPLLAPLLFLIDIVLMTASSAYGISAAIKAKKLCILTTGNLVFLIIGHCFFVTDVISAVILYRKLPKPPQDT